MPWLPMASWNDQRRLRLPSSLRVSDGAGYAKATDLLGGADKVLTPLWWAKKN